MNLPDKLSYSRIMLSIALLISAYYSKAVYAIIYVAAVLTDILDGFVARKFKLETKRGAKLDIIADNILMICTLIGLYLLDRSLIRYKYHAVMLLSFYLSVQFISVVFTKKLIMKRTYAANLAAISFPVVVFSLLYYESMQIINIYLAFMMIALTEKLFLQLSKKRKKTIFIHSSLMLRTLFILIVLFLVFTVQKLPVESDMLCFKTKCIDVEIKDTPHERALGLMYREALTDEHGMLFIFEEPGIYNFWMKNMLIPIDIIFLDSDRTIITIHKSVRPCSAEPCPLYPPGSEALYVVETASGFSSRYSLEIGQEVILP